MRTQKTPPLVGEPMSYDLPTTLRVTIGPGAQVHAYGAIGPFELHISYVLAAPVGSTDVHGHHAFRCCSV